MGMFASLVWRNIWRNSRRSVLSIASVVFAVMLALSMRSMQLGFYAQAISNVVSFQTGYVRCTPPASTMTGRSTGASPGRIRYSPWPPRQTRDGHSTPAGDLRARRRRQVDRRRHGDRDRPRSENRLTGLAARVTAGDYLAPDDDGILLPTGLADHLDVAVGDTVVVLGQGYHGMTAAGMFRVAGIVEFPTPGAQFGSGLRVAQRRAGADRSLRTADDGRAHDLRPEQSRPGGAELGEVLGDGFEVLTWEEMMPELVQFILTDNASGIIMLMIVYMVIGFGMLGTVLMMTMERTREFGVLISSRNEARLAGLDAAHGERGALSRRCRRGSCRSDPDHRTLPRASSADVGVGRRSHARIRLRTDHAFPVRARDLHQPESGRAGDRAGRVDVPGAENHATGGRHGHASGIERSSREAMIWTMSWRNIWRNKKRSGILLAAIASGLWAGLLTVGIFNGMAEQMVRTAITTRTSHVQFTSQGSSSTLTSRQRSPMARRPRARPRDRGRHAGGQTVGRSRHGQLRDDWHGSPAVGSRS